MTKLRLLAILTVLGLTAVGCQRCPWGNTSAATGPQATYGVPGSPRPTHVNPPGSTGSWTRLQFLFNPFPSNTSRPSDLRPSLRPVTNRISGLCDSRALCEFRVLQTSLTNSRRFVGALLFLVRPGLRLTLSILPVFPKLAVAENRDSQGG